MYGIHLCIGTSTNSDSKKSSVCLLTQKKSTACTICSTLGHQLDEAQIFCHEFKETSRLEVEDEKSFSEKEEERCFLGEFFRYYCYCFLFQECGSGQITPWRPRHG